MSETSPDAAERRREYSRKYREANRDRLLEQKRADYARDRERDNERSRQYYAANRDQMLSNMREWAQAHQDELREYYRQYYAPSARARLPHRSLARLPHARAGTDMYLLSARTRMSPVQSSPRDGGRRPGPAAPDGGQPGSS